jgi:DNA invertase Pin-like site-specific DNA recombinase
MPPVQILYTRVSTDEQATSGLGLDAQRARLQAEAERRGWTTRLIEDPGYSGATLNRPGLQEALSLLRSGHADTLAVAALDRLSRDLIDATTLLRRAQREGWAVVALDLGVDTTTPAGELVANVMLAIAQWERRRIGERTRQALAAAKARGVRLGRPPTVPAKIRARILQEREAGSSYSAIAAGLNADKIPTGQGAAAWEHSAVRRIVLAGTAPS